MNLQERRDKADIIAKEADIVYKKLFVLLAVNGAIGGFGLSIFEKALVVGLILLLPFLFFVVWDCSGVFKTKQIGDVNQGFER